MRSSSTRIESGQNAPNFCPEFKERNKMNEELKEMSIEQLKKVIKYHQALIKQIEKDIRRRTIRV